MTAPIADVFNQKLTLQVDHTGIWAITANPEVENFPSLLVISLENQRAIAENLIVELSLTDLDTTLEWIGLPQFLAYNNLGFSPLPVRMTKNDWESYTDPNNYTDEA